MPNPDVAVPSLPEPCPFCGASLVLNTNQADIMVRRYGAHLDHPENLCYLSGCEVSPSEVDDWNRRAAGRASAEPDGFVLVPREPTPAMMRVGLLSMWPRAAYQSGAVENVWIRMCRVGADPSTEEMTLKAIAAAPTPTASIAPKGGGEADDQWPEQPGVRWCLQCNKLGHRTTDCHSTHALNTPEHCELGRLADQYLRARKPHLYAAPVAQAAAGAGEREAFEAYIHKDRGDLTTFGRGANMHYLNSGVNHAWLGWMARAALPRPEADADRASGGGVECPDCRGSEWRGWKRGVPCHTCKGSGFTPTTKD